MNGIMLNIENVEENLGSLFKYKLIFKLAAWTIYEDIAFYTYLQFYKIGCFNCFL